MNRFWGPLTRLLSWFIRGVPFFRAVLHAPRETRELLESGRPVIFACVHQDIFAAFYSVARLLRGRPLTAMVSLSRDGGLAARGLEALGYEVARGSSSHGGGEGLLTLKSRIAAGSSVLFVCDGPKGPLGDVKAGVVRLAATTGAPILPVRAWGQLQILFRRSWTRAAVPVPLQALRLYVGAPIVAPPESQETRPVQIAVARSIAELAEEAARWASGLSKRPFKVAAS